MAPWDLCDSHGRRISILNETATPQPGSYQLPAHGGPPGSRDTHPRASSFLSYDGIHQSWGQAQSNISLPPIESIAPQYEYSSSPDLGRSFSVASQQSYRSTFSSPADKTTSLSAPELSRSLSNNTNKSSQPPPTPVAAQVDPFAHARRASGISQYSDVSQGSYEGLHELQRHSSHKGPRKTSDAKSPSNPKKKFPCREAKKYNCDMMFTTSGHASRHAKVHTGERDVYCTECNKAFGRKDNMKQHMKTHEKHALKELDKSRRQAKVSKPRSRGSSNGPAPGRQTPSSYRDLRRYSPFDMGPRSPTASGHVHHQRQKSGGLELLASAASVISL